VVAAAMEVYPCSCHRSIALPLLLILFFILQSEMPPPHPRPDSLDSQQAQAKLFAHVLEAPELTYINGEKRD
jgi:hypothetical protein